MFDTFVNLLTCVGIYALCCYLYDNLKSPLTLLRYRLQKHFSSERVKTLTELYGNWAAITGATDGIGKAYARELARLGLNVVLISRTESKLKAVATDIENDFRVKTKIIAADFHKGAEAISHIEQQIELDNIPVAILINNVGQYYTEPGVMASFSADELWNLIFTNIGAVTQLSRYFIKRMHNAGIKGAIVNVSSGTELQALPYGAVYGASKAYTRSLTFSLQLEARRNDITVQLLSPNFVRTKINKYSKTLMRGGLFIPNAETYARSAVATLGKVDETTGYFWHAVQTAIIKLVPASVRGICAEWLAYLLVTDKITTL